MLTDVQALRGRPAAPAGALKPISARSPRACPWPVDQILPYYLLNPFIQGQPAGTFDSREAGSEKTLESPSVIPI